MTQGQGKPLPEFMKLKGEWILENVAFLYHSDYSGTAPQATLTLAQERQDGSHALGFDCAQLAGEFGIDVATLLEANREQSLVFVGDMDVTPTHGGVSAVAYIFRIEDRRAVLTTETHTNQQERTA